MTSERGHRTVRAAILAGAGILAACSSTGSGDSSAVDVNTNTASLTGMSHVFTSASDRAGVPRDLLVAIAHVEDGLQIPAQRLDIEEDVAVPVAGPLMLRHGKLNTLARAAELKGTTELALRKDSDLALEAGALVLAELGTKTGAKVEDLASWKSALEEMSGYADDARRQEYAHRVFAALARGGALPARDGEVIALAKHDLPPTLTLDISSKLHSLATAEFPGAEFIPTSCANKCNVGRPAGAKVLYVVIHDTEGSWDSAVATLQNDPGKSVQYIIGRDGRTAQFVVENTTAWHAGNSFFNERSVGIEHVGTAVTAFTAPQYDASVKLVTYLTKKYAVPLDRAHIVGHDQIPGKGRAESSAPCSGAPKACEADGSYGGSNHHTDPGVWEWPTFMDRLGGASKCNDVSTLLNCSYDKKKAFKCVGTSVLVESCSTCDVKAIGQDDVCAVITTTSTPPGGTTPPAGSDPGATPPPSGATPPADGAQDPGESPVPSRSPASSTASAEDPQASSSSGGCSVGNTRARGTSFAFGMVALGAALAAFRRRRSAGGSKLS